MHETPPTSLPVQYEVIVHVHDIVYAHHMGVHHRDAFETSPYSHLRNFSLPVPPAISKLFALQLRDARDALLEVPN